MIWSAAERRAWAPSARLAYSDWAEAHSVIVSKDAAEPGRWRNDRAPYLRGILDALGDPLVEEVYVQKAARTGGSETGRRALCCWIDQDPGPVLILFPTEDKTKEQLKNELVPLLTQTPKLAPYLTGALRDLSKESLELTHMRIYPAWAGSTVSLSDRTCRYVWVAEADLVAEVGDDPIGRARRRTQTFAHRKKIYAESTPTTRDGAIAKAFEAAPDKRRYYVPCPHCATAQTLVWAQVKWPKDAAIGRRDLAARILAEQSAWYECIHCRGRIEERYKPEMLSAGEWRCDGMPGPIRAFHVPGLLSMLGMTWSRMAAEFLRAKQAYEEGDVEKLYEFVTQGLGEPFEDQVNRIKSTIFGEKAGRGYKPGMVPKWAGLVIATADTQKDGFYWVVRAWGRGERSRQIARGEASSFADLERLTLGARFKLDGWPDEVVAPSRLFIDSGGGGVNEAGDASRTDEVYRFARERPGRVVPVKGRGGDAQPNSPMITPTTIEYKPPGATRSPYEVSLLLLDTQRIKDVLAGWISQTPTPEAPLERWELAANVDAEYVSHMTAERKILVPKGNTRVERWEKIGGRRCDYWDAEVYQVAAAKVERVEHLPDEAALDLERAAAVKARGQVATNPAPSRYGAGDGRAFLVNRR